MSTYKFEHHDEMEAEPCPDHELLYTELMGLD